MPQELQYLEQRASFHSLLVANPNYFGNLKDSKYKPVLNFQANTFYEQLGCVGYQPQLKRLDGTITVKQSSGYNGGLCSTGSQEYVRFYLSYDNGVTWVDQGLSSATVHDTPGTLPLQYDVSLTINPQTNFCFVENLPLVRGILSWNTPPPPNTPDYAPVWGNTVDAHIQIGPRTFFVMGQLLEATKVKVSPELKAIVSSEQKIPVAEAQPAAYAQLLASAAYKEVPRHRSLFSPVQKAIQAGAAQNVSGVHPLATSLNLDLEKFQIDPSALITAIQGVNGDTSFEQLNCIGLNPQASSDSLAGVLTVKKSSGYSGAPCSSGSTEYVAFWLDYGSGWVFAGNTSVVVHDFSAIPAGGLQYSVFRPVDFSKHQEPCGGGPVEVKVRAILSWEVAPPSNDPDFVPTWGNRVEANIVLRPQAVKPTGYPAFMDTVGGMFTADIDLGTGLAVNGKVSPTAGFTAIDSPFGGEIVIAGHIGNAPDISQGASKLKYRVLVSSDGINYNPLGNSFTVNRTQLQSGLWSYLPDISLIPDIDGYYQYQEDLVTNASGTDAQIFVAGNLLARWQTGGAMSGIWHIKIEVKDPVTNIIYPGAQNIAVCLDNKAPDITLLNVTSGAGSCGDFHPGDTISGNYAANDLHFWEVGFQVLPSGDAVTKSGVVATATSESGTWTWQTTAATIPCGYVIYMVASDRTIVNSGAVGWTTPASVGVCIRPPE